MLCLISVVTSLGLLDFLDPEKLIKNGGLLVLAAIVFAESGLLIGFFLPGDSLLFISGFLASDAGGNVLDHPLPLIIAVVVIAAIAGDQVGYLFGKKAGPAIFSREDSKIFKQAHIHKAQDFFDHHGSKTIVLARFVPIVRTFAPIVAGVGNMDYRTFVTFNVLGGLLWGAGVTTLGYFLGQIEFIKNNIEIAILAVIGISLLPAIFELIRHRRQKQQDSEL